MIYLDNAATTFVKPPSVMRAMNEYMFLLGGNPGRGGHFLSLRAGDAVYKCREVLANLIGASPEEVVLTPSATMALNTAIKGVLKPNDHAIITCFEHNSVLRPVHKTCAYSVCTSPENALSLVHPETKMLIVNHASNVNGVIADLEGYKKAAHDAGLLLLVDASQTAGHLPLSVSGIDMLAAAGHKGLFGPQGTGFLYVRKGLKLNSLIEGGTGFMSESYTQPDLMPEALESGTLNGVGFAGLAEGAAFAAKQLNSGITENLNRALKQGLAAIPKVHLLSPVFENTAPAVAFTVENTDSVAFSDFMSEKHKICVRSGLHCAPLAHKTLGTVKTGAVRASLSYFNTLTEVEKFLNIIDMTPSFSV